jgi:hypothetical protein
MVQTLMVALAMVKRDEFSSRLVDELQLLLGSSSRTLRSAETGTGPGISS